MHLRFKPLPDIHFAVRSSISAPTTDLVFDEASLVCPTVGNNQNSLTFFESFDEISSVLRIIRPFFNSLAMLKMFKPISFVACTISFLAEALPMKFVRHPRPRNHRLIFVDQPSLSRWLAFHPLAKVVRFIWEHAKSESMSKLIVPSPDINSAIL